MWIRLGVHIDGQPKEEEWMSAFIERMLDEGKLTIDGDTYFPDIDDNKGFERWECQMPTIKIGRTNERDNHHCI